ncbi:hypothetical protein N7495_007837 [Penicillium taxi]|uniref:uncharacterized protein n=1 Tax=Penicillium taxi TaxID=168475 RepID=UPI00254512D4|nr:uncharacterized protein N7495_007837 [Penicillium taxi]KAJ5887796.1 hypothetical protein N7495_007837 [Penicillium taxi]
MLSSIFLLHLFAIFGLLCQATPLHKRDSGFEIYAYGTGISGLQVHYDDVQVSSSKSYTWIASSQSGNVTWAPKTLYLEDDGATATEVGFTSASSTSGKLTNVFWLYGQSVIVNVDSATFYAEPVAHTPGHYTLCWSPTDVSGDGIIVTLRTIAPSTDSVLS